MKRLVRRRKKPGPDSCDSGQVGHRQRHLEKILPEQLDPVLVRDLPFEFLKSQPAVPVVLENGRVAIAMAEPVELEAYDAIVNVLGRVCERVISPATEIETAISRCYYRSDSHILRDNRMAGESAAQGDAGEELPVLTKSISAAPACDSAFQPGRDSRFWPRDGGDIDAGSIQTRAEDLLSVANKAPVIKLVNRVFFDAFHSRASDIHIEPYDERIRVRFRIDGVLHDVLNLPKSQAAAVLSRVKIMAKLDIAERRLPQDGQSRIRIGPDLTDIRVSIIPTLGGERAVLRLLDKSRGRLSLDQIGFSTQTLKSFRQFISASHGIILLTGPTGSGKTTTLYAAINELNCEQRNILTVEDPIEYQLAGVGQMQVRPKIGLAFANCLRHILRQDPNVIMIGEIRDAETAQIAIQASLTGHLVLSTLHTNDSASAVTRLIDMGIEPYLICSSVIAVVAQRLVRVVCPGCRQAYAADRKVLALLEKCETQSISDTELYCGQGCRDCFNTGYLGRTGIFEMLTIGDDMKELITDKAGAHVIKERAVENGTRTLRDDGLGKVLAGVTTVEEVCRVTQQCLQTDVVEAVSGSC